MTNPVYAVFEVTFVADATPADLADYDRYRAAVTSLIEAHGGRYLARAWGISSFEGDPVGDRCHLVEFPDGDAARAFWADPAYREIAPLRAGAVEVRAVLIESD